MAATSTYPTTRDVDPIVRGDALTIAVPITVNGVAQNITTWTWRSQVRKGGPDGRLLFPFTVGIDGTSTLTLSATAAQTALLTNDCWFDVEQLTPVVRTWWIVNGLYVTKDVSHA